MRALWIAILLPFPLLACASPAVISDINDSALKVQGNAYTPVSEINLKAEEGCQIYNKSPVGISTTCLNQYCTMKEYLFACR